MAVGGWGVLDEDLRGALAVIVEFVDLKGHGPTLHDIAKRVFCSVSKAGHLYLLLEARGYLERGRADDGRVLAHVVHIIRRSFD